MSDLSKWLAERGEGKARDWTRLKAQYDYITTTSKFSMYSGGFGAGKTSALNIRIVSYLTMVPNNLGMLARQDGKSLRQTTLVGLLEMIPKAWIKRHDQQKGILELTPEMGGSALVYGDLKNLNDLVNHDLGFFAIDQAEETTWDVWEFLTGRIRRKNPILDPETGLHQYWVSGKCEVSKERHFAIGESQHCVLCGEILCDFDETDDEDLQASPWEMLVYPRFGFGVCNTEDPSHWIFEKFNGLPGKDETVSEGLDGYQAFHATTYDALKAGFVDRDYVQGLETTYASNQLMFDRYVLGKWVVASGLIFPGFSKETHVLHDDSVRFDGEPILAADLPAQEYIDPGITAITAVGWMVVEHCQCGCNKPNFYLIDEHYVASSVPEYHCAQIKAKREMLGREVVWTEMDNQAFSRSNVQRPTATSESSVYSLAQLYIEQGIYVSRNQKDWDSGYARLTTCLADDPEHQNPVTGEFGAPHFYVFSRCSWFIWEMLKYKWKVRKYDKTRTDEPTEKDDHHMDGVIGFFAGRPEYRVKAPVKIDDRTAWAIAFQEEEEADLQPAYDFMEM